jgi:D-alanyl-D-alanine carboxypeptidase/D-alanyl-D-alanine-endopeptidase (penicillin-binding protein 4)
VTKYDFSLFILCVQVYSCYMAFLRFSVSPFLRGPVVDRFSGSVLHAEDGKLMRRVTLGLCSVLFLSGCAATISLNDQAGLGPDPVRSISPYPSLKRGIDAIVKEKLLPQTNAGIKIVSLKTGEIIYQYNPELLMTPASNLKLFTAAAALTTFGAERSVETRVSLGGEGRRDLYLKGCGDALLTTEDLRQLSRAVSGSDLPRQEYRLVGDVSCFDDLYWGKGWIWDDEPDPDEMYISPLSVNGNAITVEVSPAEKPGKPALLRIVPATSYVTIRNTATTSGKDSPAAVSINRRAGERGNVVTVSGTVPLGAAAVVQRVSVWRPELFALSVFRDFLQSDGVPVSETVLGATPAEAQLLAVNTRTVAELVSFMLKKSDNLTAESLLKLMALEVTHSPGSAENGVKRVLQYLENRGIPTTHQVIVDGSGVSRYNLTTAGTIIRVLEEMYRDQVNFPAVLRSLAVAGKDGTLAHRMVSTPAEGNVKAKSGTMNGISALSGYVTTPLGEPLAFSIIIQNYAGSSNTAMEVQDSICVLLSGFR